MVSLLHPHERSKASDRFPLRGMPCVALALLLVQLTCAGARAQDSEASTTAAARSLFERGATAADAGDHATAVDLLGRSLSLRPSPVVAFNRAQSLVALGRLVEASETLARVEREATQDALRTAAAELRAMVAPRLAHVTVAVSPEDTDAEIQLDGAPLAAPLRGVATPVDPGTHVATALRDGVEVARAEATVAESGSGSLPLAVPAVTIAEPPPLEIPVEIPEQTPPAQRDDTVLIAVLTTVGVLVVAGVGIGVGVALTSQTPSPVEGNLSPGIVRFGP